MTVHRNMLVSLLLLKEIPWPRIHLLGFKRLLKLAGLREIVTLRHALSNKSHHEKPLLQTRQFAVSKPVGEDEWNDRGFGATHSPKAYSRDRSNSRTWAQQTPGDLVMPQLPNASPHSPLASLCRRWTRILRLLWRETSYSQSHETDKLA